MAEMVVSLAVEQLVLLMREEADLLRGIHKEFADIKDELESIQALLKDAENRAAANKKNERVKIWVKQVIEASFRIEDVIDEYIVYMTQERRDPGCVALLHKISHFIKIVIRRHQIGSEIRDIKSSLCGIKERSERYGFQVQPSFGQGPNSYNGSQNAKWHDPRMAALYMTEDEVVGFEVPRDKMINRLVNGRAERIVISVVGMGGLGKTTLAKKVFDSKVVIGHFDCRVWITVSQSYNVEGLLRIMLLKLCKQEGDNPPGDIVQMDVGSLIEKVRNYLHQKRYVVVFDDVWDIHFWDTIQFAVIDDKNRSKIIITTRNMDVVVSCKKSSFVKVLELEPLTKEQSLELFNKKAFRFGYGGCCPDELTDISFKIVQKCKGLPLAIVVIGGLLSTKEKNAFEWLRFSENINLGLKKDSHLTGIKEILGFSYDDLPLYLKSCLLYFGMYPEDYEVKTKRLIRQWIAEGFVKGENIDTLKNIAEGYLTELINRSLVQVSSIKIDGKVKSCRAHDLVRVMILEKCEDLSFGQCLSKDGQSSLSGKTRRLTIATTSSDLIACIGNSRIRSLLVFLNTVDFVSRILTKYKLLKVLDFEDVTLFSVPKNFGNLIHLKYLSFKDTCLIGYYELPKSIALLNNLETLDVRGTEVREMPKVISRLTKLRHLMGNKLSLIQLADVIGGMTSLQTLCEIDLQGKGEGSLELIKELGKLKQLRELGLDGVREKHGSTLSSSINEMRSLEKLHIRSKFTAQNIELNLIPSAHMLGTRSILLCGELQRLPEWIPQIQNLVKLKLEYSKLTEDPMKSLKSMQNLLSLSIIDDAYEGESLHFQDGGFLKLNELHIGDLSVLNSMVIDNGALCSLKKLNLWRTAQLKVVPTGIQYLENLEVLGIQYMPTEFVQSITSLGGKQHRIIGHVPLVTVNGKLILHSS